MRYKTWFFAADDRCRCHQDVGDATLQLTLKVVALLPPQPMFFRVQVHAAMTAQDIHQLGHSERLGPGWG